MTNVVLVCVIVLLVILLLTIFIFSYNIDLHMSTDLTVKGIKVVGLGLPRTGTCSLSAALKLLGYSVQHFPINFHKRRHLYERKRDALIDISMLSLRPTDMHRLYPSAQFIYSDRDDRSWVKSMKKLLKTLRRVIFVPGMLDVLCEFLRLFGTSYESIISAKRLYERELYALEKSGVRIHRVYLTVKEKSDADKWDDLQSAIGNSMDMSSSLFPNETHIWLHMKQVWTW